MISYDIIKKSQDCIVENWGEDGKRVIEICHTQTPFNKGMEEFLNHCIACGDNWNKMLLTGIKKLFPTVYDAIPNNMGWKAWACICSVLTLCGVDSNE